MWTYPNWISALHFIVHTRILAQLHRKQVPPLIRAACHDRGLMPPALCDHVVRLYTPNHFMNRLYTTLVCRAAVASMLGKNVSSVDALQKSLSGGSNDIHFNGKSGGSLRSGLRPDGLGLGEGGIDAVESRTVAQLEEEINAARLSNNVISEQAKALRHHGGSGQMGLSRLSRLAGKRELEMARESMSGDACAPCIARVTHAMKKAILVGGVSDEKLPEYLMDYCVAQFHMSSKSTAEQRVCSDLVVGMQDMHSLKRGAPHAKEKKLPIHVARTFCHALSGCGTGDSTARAPPRHGNSTLGT